MQLKKIKVKIFLNNAFKGVVLRDMTSLFKNVCWETN